MKDFHGFKKIAADHKSTTFAHPNGSKLIVAHGGLDPKTLKKISALPIQKACGGPVQKFSGDSGDPSDSEVQGMDPGMVQKLQERADQVRNAGTMAKRVLFGSPEELAHLNPQAAPPVQTPAPGQMPPAGGDPMPTNIPIQQAPMNNMRIPAPGDNIGGIKYDPYQGYNTSMAGNTAEAQAVGDLEDQKAQIYAKNGQDMQALNYQMQQNAWNNQIETQNAIDDMKNGHIDPKAYVNNMTGGKRIGTAIGLMLGGISEGLLHNGKNPALEMLQRDVDRDVEAQVQNRNNKTNIFNAMQKQYGNQQDALKMTQAFYMTKMQNDVNEAAAKIGSPLALARAQQMNGPLQNQIQQLHMDVGRRQAGMQALANGQIGASAAIPFMVPNPAEQQKAIEAYGKIQEINKLHSAMRESAQHLRGQMGNGVLSPNDTNSAKQAFAGAIQKISEGRYNGDAAEKIVTSMLPQMMDMGNTDKNKDKRMDEFMDAFRQEPTAVLNSHFIPAPQMPPRFTKRN